MKSPNRATEYVNMLCVLCVSSVYSGIHFKILNDDGLFHAAAVHNILCLLAHGTRDECKINGAHIGVSYYIRIGCKMYF